MVSYDDLGTLTGKLERAAIDAFMKSDGWVVSENIYDWADGEGNSESVTRPGADGEGGGEWSTTLLREWIGTGPDMDYAKKFDEIRTDIDDQLKPWHELPDPSDISPLVESMRQAERTLSVGEVSPDNGKVTGGGKIGGNLNLIIENSVAMSGQMIATFKSDFLAQLGPAIGGQHAIALILGGALAAQEKVWEGARQSVADTVHVATTAFDSYVTGGGGTDWEVALKVVGYAVAGVSIFATGGTGAAISIGVANLGLTILQDALSAKEKTAKEKAEKPDTYDYDGILKAFKTDLQQLDSRIETEETTLRDNLNENLGQIRSDQGSYDLTRPALLKEDDFSALGEEEAVVITPSLVDEITDTYLPAVAEELRKAQDDVDKASDTTPLHRHGEIGIGQYGLNQEYGEARWLLWELLGNLAWEVEVSAKHLALAVEDIQSADGASQKALEEHTDQIEDETTCVPDPWNDPLHGPGKTGL